jgi:hypothetical protein
MSSRPLGITILVILSFLNMAAYASLAVLSIVNRDALAEVLRAISPGGAGPAAVHLAMGKFLPVYYVALLLLVGALGLGFWKLWNWTRIVTLALIAVSLCGAAAQSLNIMQSGSSSAGAMFWVRIASSVLISVLFGWYLLTAKVRAAFSPSASKLESGSPNRSVRHA